MIFERSAKIQAKVSLTPLIDMVFLLVVFFMLTTTFGRNEGIELSFSENVGQSVAGDIEAILVAVGENGHLLLDSDPGGDDDDMLFTSAEHDGFRSVIRNIFVTSPGRQVQIYITGNAKVQDIVTAIDQIQIAGGSDIIFIDNGTPH